MYTRDMARPPGHWKKVNDARKGKRRAWYYKKKHGISEEELRARLQNQGWKCPICQAPLPENRAVLDHDHVTKQLRDVLCHNCNLGLGHMKDDPTRLRIAAAYLEFHARGRR